MHVTDWFIALPGLPLAISLAAVLGQGDASITIAIAVTSWTGTARLVRAQTLAVEARPFVERARALGAGQPADHGAPGAAQRRAADPGLQHVDVASAMLAETTLTFLGLGNPTEVSWGGMLNEGFNEGAVSAGAWWYLLPPGIAIVIVVLGFTLTGRAVEAVLNPRMGRAGRSGA